MMETMDLDAENTTHGIAATIHGADRALVLPLRRTILRRIEMFDPAPMMATSPPEFLLFFFSSFLRFFFSSFLLFFFFSSLLVFFLCSSFLLFFFSSLGPLARGFYSVSPSCREALPKPHLSISLKRLGPGRQPCPLRFLSRTVVLAIRRRRVRLECHH